MGSLVPNATRCMFDRERGVLQMQVWGEGWRMVWVQRVVERRESRVYL